MVNEQDGLRLAPALRIAVNSGRGRKFVMVDEQEGLQLPPALRIAANSGRGRKQKKDNKRMTLKNEARAMRLRLSQMDDKTDCVPAVNSPNIDTPPTCSTPGYRTIEGGSRSNSGKYSNDILNKKIKKAEKLLDKTTFGSKEFKALQKKLIGYHAQFKEHNQQGNARFSMDGSFNPAEVKEKELSEKQERGTINCHSVSEEFSEKERFDENRIEGKVNEQDDENKYSLEMLKKKLKKLEKMVLKSTPGSKEYKKLQIKRMEYGRLIKEQDAINSIAEDSEPKTRLQQSEQIEKERRGLLRDQARHSWQRASKKKQKEKEAAERAEAKGKIEDVRQRELSRLEKEAIQKEEGRQQRGVSLRIENDDAETVKVEDSESKLSRLNFYKHYGEDEQMRKQAFLEEARRLKQEALVKKRKEEEISMKVEVTEDEEAKKEERSILGMSVIKKIHRKNSEENEALKYVIDDNDDQRKKQAFLEEDRRLKEEPLEKKTKEEELKMKAEAKEDDEAKNKKHSSHLRTLATKEIQNKNQEECVTFKAMFVGNDDLRKKESYLEEARRLKQDAMRKKFEDAEHKEYLQHEDNKTEEAKSLDEECLEKIGSVEMKHDSPQLHRTDDQDQRADFLDQIRSKTEEQKDKEQNYSASFTESALYAKRPNLLKKIKPKTEKQNEEENQYGDITRSADPSINREKTNFLEDFKSTAERGNEDKQQINFTHSTETTSCRKKPNFLEDIKSKPKTENEDEDEDEDEQRNTSIPSDDSTTHRKKPNFLEEIKSEIEGREGDERQKYSTLSSDPIAYRKKLEPLHEIEVKREVQRKEQNQDDDDSTRSVEYTLHTQKLNFLEEIKSKAKREIDEDKQQLDSTPSNDFTTWRKNPNFLKEVKSRADTDYKDDQQSDSMSSSTFTTLRKKPYFVRESESKTNEWKEEDNQQGGSTPLFNPSAHRKKLNFLEEMKSKSEKEKEENKQNRNSTPSSDPTAYRKKSNFLEEIKSKTEVGNEDEQQNDSTLSHMSNVDRKKPNFLEEIKSKAEGEKEVKQQNDSTISHKSNVDRKKPNFLEEIKPKEEGGKEDEQQNDSTIPHVSNVDTKTPNFLDEIKAKAEAGKEVEQQNDSSTLSPISNVDRKKPSFLEEIKSKAEGMKEDDSTQSLMSNVDRKKPSFLEEIKSKAEGGNEDEPQNDSVLFSISNTGRKKPNFLEEIQSKAQRMNEDVSTQSPVVSKADKKKPSFVEEIKPKAEGGIEDEQQNDLTRSADSNADRKKPKFLEEIRIKTQKQKREVERSTCSSSCESGTREKHQNHETVKERVQQPEQLHQEETSASPVNQREEASKGYLDRRNLPEPLSSNTKKILRGLESNEIRQKKLERSLLQNGIHITEDISYEEAKDKIADITDSMKELVAEGMDSYTMEKEYFRLEEELSKFTTALMLTDEYAEEHRRLEHDWEDSIKTDNIAAIHKLRSHMPVKIRHTTEEELVTTATPNGKTLPKVIARKFKRTNILQLLRVDPDDIEMMHPSLLEGMRTTGLTLTERRALHEHFRDVVERWGKKRSDPSIERKWQWFQMLRSKFKETLAAYLRCIEQFGPPGSHQYAKRGDPEGGGCPLLGNQCPMKADASIDYSDDYGYTKEATYESSGNRSESKKGSQRETLISKEKSSKLHKSSESEIMQDYRDCLRLDANETYVDKKLLRELFHSDKRTKNLEKQLTHAGLSLPKDDISYDMAKVKVAELTEELNQVAVNMGDTSNAKQLAKLEHTFGELSKELDKFTNALMLTKEWAQEQKDRERQWEIDISAANYEALQKVRRHMPVNIRNVSETSLATDLTPNGKVLLKAVAKKFKRTNILMILRTDPSAVELMHPSSLEAMRTTGLTLTERRAIHEHLKEIAPKWKAMTSDKMCERKWMWHASLQSKFKEVLEKYNKHVKQYGLLGCPSIGNQCPVKADLAIDYSGDYGFPDNAEYEQQIVAKSNLLSMEELEKRRLEDNYN